MPEPIEIAQMMLSRFIELVKAPLTDTQMLWTAVPLVIATIFMTLYFGKYRKEELGWATAFGNTMVFLFVSLSIIEYMYYVDGDGSWNNLFSNEFYLTITVALTLIALFFMFITYYHLLPKKVAFFLFSAPPVNVSVYVLMTIIYTEVPADYITLGAAVVLFLVIMLLLKILQKIESMASHPEGIFAEEEKKKKEEKKEEPEEEKPKKKKIITFPVLF